MRVNLWVLMLLACGVGLAAAASDDEFVGPFPTWADVKRDYGAVGDGKADDTEAFQRALDDMGTPASKHHHLWIPAGTYRITKTLARAGVAGMALIGEDPATTVLRWDGPAGAGGADDPNWRGPGWDDWSGVHASDMFWFNGRNSRFERLTLDGAGKASAGFAFKWNSMQAEAGQTPSHRISLADVTFRDLAIGFDGGGKLLSLDSEVLMRRCKFLRCREYGVGLHHFNAVDYWLWHCEFTDCGVGVSNEPKPHGGVVHVYESLFRNSREADFTIFHAGFFGLRHNTSIGSRRFFHAKNNGANGAIITLQGNTIIDPIEHDALVFETIGNINLMDNTILSRADATGPVVRGELGVPVSLSAFNNTFSVAQPFQVKGQLVETGTKVVARGKVRLAVPVLPGPPPRATGPIFPVDAGANAEGIQQVINQAAAHAAKRKGSRPVVFLPRAIYKIDRTLVIPANTPLYLAGDGVYQWPDGTKGCLLTWTGPADGGPVLRLEGPSRAVLSDFGVIGPKLGPRRKDGPTPPTLGDAIAVAGADQRDGRVYLQECNLGATAGIGLLSDGLDETRVQAIAFEGGGLNWWSRDWDGVMAADPYFPYPAIRVVGGPKAKAGKGVAGRVELLGGNTGRYDVMDGGTLLVRDTWYESNWAPFHMRLRGNGHFILDTGLDAQYTHPNLKGAGATYTLEDFTGTLALLNVGGHYNADNPALVFRGNCAGARVLLLGISGQNGWLPDLTKTAGAKLTLLNARSGAAIARNPLPADPDALVAFLAPTREARLLPPVPRPAGATDLRLIRIRTDNARVGLCLRGR